MKTATGSVPEKFPVLEKFVNLVMEELMKLSKEELEQLNKRL